MRRVAHLSSLRQSPSWLARSENVCIFCQLNANSRPARVSTPSSPYSSTSVDSLSSSSQRVSNSIKKVNASNLHSKRINRHYSTLRDRLDIKEDGQINDETIPDLDNRPKFRPHAGKSQGHLKSQPTPPIKSEIALPEETATSQALEGPELELNSVEAEEQWKEEKREKIQQIQDRVERTLDHPDYEEAQNWDGLMMVGGETEWDTGRKFVGFLSKDASKKAKSFDRLEVTALIYRALIEVLTAAENEATIMIDRDYEIGSLLNETKDVKLEIKQESSGEAYAQLIYANERVRNEVLKAGWRKAVDRSGFEQDRSTGIDETFGRSEVDDLASNSPLEDNVIAQQQNRREVRKLQLEILQGKEELKQTIYSWGKDWLRVSLENSEIKLATIARLAHFLGRTIPDHTIHTSHTVGDLVSALARPDPPTKVHEYIENEWFAAVERDLQQQQSQQEHEEVAAEQIAKETQKTLERLTLKGMPNVDFNAKKLDPLKRERDTGRWKVIRQELVRRGLPVTRKDHVRGTKLQEEIKI